MGEPYHVEGGPLYTAKVGESCCGEHMREWMVWCLMAAVAVGPAGARTPETAGRVAGFAGAPAGAELVDLNTATKAELMQLPGIGAAYADRIVRGRPYTAKNQLLQRGVLPGDAYARIRDLVVARHPRG